MRATVDRFRRLARYRTTVRALQQLSRQELRDLMIPPQEIRRLARESALR